MIYESFRDPKYFQRVSHDHVCNVMNQIYMSRGIPNVHFSFIPCQGVIFP